MNFKLTNTKLAVLGLALLIADVGAAVAATVVLSGVGSCTYDSFNAQANGDMSVTCASTKPQDPTVIPVCAPTASANTISAGGTVTLYANCTNPSITKYAWSITDPISNYSAASSTISVTQQVNTTYSVVATNAAGNSAPASKTVLVSSEQVGSNDPNCKVVDVTWPNAYTYGQAWQYLPKGKILAMRLKVPENKAPASAGTAYADVAKYLSISDKECDFSPELATKGCMTGARTNDPTLWTTGGNEAGMCKLPPAGSFVYYNVKNSKTLTGADECPVGKDCRFGHFW